MALKPHERQLAITLTGIPTAAGLEDRVIAFIEGWCFVRSARLRLQRDDGGNLLITRKDAPRDRQPLLVTAHLDHPAFVVRRRVDPRTLELEFRGGVHDAYFVGAKLSIIDAGDREHVARITSLDTKAKPYKRVTARLARTAPSIAAGDIARWHLPKPRVTKGLLHTHACDDLAAAAAALVAFDRLLANRKASHVGLLFTRAEEVGFVGAIHAARNGFVPRNARLICLENSRSFPHDSPIGAGAILRVGDRLSVFAPGLTNELGDLFGTARAKDPSFIFQRKLMPGGACEATAFATHGFESTCLCLPLGNYHNMADIDGVLARKAKARVGSEFVSMADFESLVRMIEIAATGLGARDGWRRSSMKLMDMLHRRGRGLLKPRRAHR
jgi:endoglucanase